MQNIIFGQILGIIVAGLTVTLAAHARRGLITSLLILSTRRSAQRSYVGHSFLRAYCVYWPFSHECPAYGSITVQLESCTFHR